MTWKWISPAGLRSSPGLMAGCGETIAERLLASGATVETAGGHRVESLRPRSIGTVASTSSSTSRSLRRPVSPTTSPPFAATRCRGHRGARRPDSQRRLGARRHPRSRRSRGLRRAAAILSLTRGRSPSTAARAASSSMRSPSGAIDGGRPARCPASDACPACAERRAPAEIADAALFLLDPENSYTTGHVLVVDGGWTAGYARELLKREGLMSEIGAVT